MTFVFWQNIISFHQSAFLNALVKENKVVLIVEKELSDSLKNSGWKVPDIIGLELIIAPNDNQIKAILKKYSKAWHFISGLHAYNLGTKALKYSVKLDCVNIAIITESFNTSGFKGKIRKFKYLWLSKKYEHVVKAIFVTGLPARKCFEQLKFNSNILFDWAYFTESLASNSFKSSKEILPSLLFVGSIDHRKNIIPILPVLIKKRKLYHKFYIVGDGNLVSELEAEIAGVSAVEYLGTLKNAEIQKLMAVCDLLILPSIFDGWGAVVNEALSNGMRVLCSDNCGASILLDGKHRGSVFNIEANNFELHLVKWLKTGVISDAKREGIIEWSKNHISGAVAASYFVDSIEFLVKPTETRPKAPWL